MKLFFYIASLFASGTILAQQPTHVPSPQNNTPVDLNNWFDIIVFIVLPLIVVIIYFLWRAQLKKDKALAEKEEENSK